MNSNKLPYNILSLLGEIGEQQVLLRLAIFAHNNPNWQVFRNVGEAGYDIMLERKKPRKRIAIEVKTRQHIFTTSKHSHLVHFHLSQGEYDACDFLVGYYLDENQFFIIPKKELKPIGTSPRWRYIVTYSRKGELHPKHRIFLNNWGLIHRDFA
jgi:hypothetical protein